MLTVYHMPPKNQFPTGISSGYYKSPCQDKPQPITTLGFTSDCLGTDYEKEGSYKPGTAFTGAEILNFSSTKPGVGLVLCARGFDSIRPDSEIETTKSDKFLRLFTS
jgi:hypothetical protein